MSQVTCGPVCGDGESVWAAQRCFGRSVPARPASAPWRWFAAQAQGKSCSSLHSDHTWSSASSRDPPSHWQNPLTSSASIASDEIHGWPPASISGDDDILHCCPLYGWCDAVANILLVHWLLHAGSPYKIFFCLPCLLQCLPLSPNSNPAILTCPQLLVISIISFILCVFSNSG